MPVDQAQLEADLTVLFSDLTGNTAAEGAAALAQAIADNVTDPAGGSVADGDYGDITVDSGGTLWTINAGVVDRDTLNEELLPSGTAGPTDEALRALGTGADDACAGNDARLSDTRTPTDGSVTAAKVAASLKPSGSAAAGDEALRALGTSSSTACAGNDSRLSDSRAPSGSASGDLSGSYPGPTVAKIGGVAVTVDTDGTLAANSDAKLATQKATKTYADAGYRPGGTDVAVADGGTGASTPAGARSNLGLVIGTDVAVVGVATNYTTPGSTSVAIPTGAKLCVVESVGAGGSGGSGRRGAASSNRYGGGAGAGGGRARVVIPVSELTGPLTVVVGAGSTGGAAQTSDSTDGNPGTAGGASYVTDAGGRYLVYAGGGPGGNAGGSGGGAGGTASTLAEDPGSSGTAGQVGSNPTAAADAVGGGGGGGGGGISSGNTQRTGGTGGTGGLGLVPAVGVGGTAGTTGGGNGGNGAAVSGVAPGHGGGGGGGNSAGVGGNGGNGSGYGGGGGGGGASVNGNNSGAGGTSTGGYVRLTFVG